MGFFGKFFSSPAVSVRADNARFSVIDTETTGLAPHNGDRIIELAAVTFDSRFNELDRWESLIHPGETPVLNSDLHQQLPHGPYRLSALLERMGLENSHAHSAAADAAATGAMLSVLFGDDIDGLSRELQKMPAFSCMHTSQWGLPYGRPMPRE